MRIRWCQPVEKNYMYLKASFEACISLISCFVFFPSHENYVVLKHVYLLIPILFSFPWLKTSFEAYMCYILCFIFFPSLEN